MSTTIQIITIFLAIFPIIIVSECCHATVYTFEKTNKSNCKDYGGALKRISFVTRSNQCVVRICGNGLKTRSFYCGIGSCNLFGCNCDNGCIPGDARKAFEKLFKPNITRILY